MTKRLRVGIIGAGSIARGAHLPGYLRVSDRVDVVAVASRSFAGASAFADEFGIPFAFGDVEEMLRTVELDAVSICTPNKFHAAMAITAMRAGCHVLCEKPPAMTVAEAEEMARVSEETGKVLTFCFNNRHSVELETLKRFIDAGELGDIYAVRTHALRRRGIPGWGVFTDKELQGGGPLIDIGVHMLDAALYLMGYPEPDVVLGSTYQKIGNRPGVGLRGQWDWQNYSVEDYAAGMVKFKNGATLMLETSFAANIQESNLKKVTLLGDRGGADLFPLQIYQEKHDTLIDVTPVYLPERNVYEVQMERFVDACLNGTKPISTAREGVILQKIMNAIYDSAETEEAVKL